MSIPTPLSDESRPRSQNDIEEMNNHSAMQRIALLEDEVRALKAALLRAFGSRWMDGQKARDEPTGQ